LQRFQAGGAERQALYLAQGLIRHRHRVTIFAFGQASGMGWERFNGIGATLVASGFNEKVLDPGSGIKHKLTRWLYTRKLLKLIRQIKPEVILPFTYKPNVIFGTLWKKMGAEACFWNQRDEGRWFLGRPFELMALKNCTGILSNSLEGKYFLEKFTTNPIKVIHNGVVIPNDQCNPDLSDKIKVVMIANLKRHKDHLTLLMAWKMICDTNPKKNFELLLVGKEGDNAESLKDLVKQSSMEGSVTFTGQISDVNGLLRTCHLGVFSSNTEGIPNGVLECMALGMAVVATRITGTQEALGKEYPFLTIPGDAEDMSLKLLMLINDPDLRAYWGLKNRERVLKEFDINKMIGHYLELIS
jgi:glycosyltransferase involved in cell wall biosynthesis